MNRRIRQQNPGWKNPVLQTINQNIRLTFKVRNLHYWRTIKFGTQESL
jgi:hypothetical protein